MKKKFVRWHPKDCNWCNETIEDFVAHFSDDIFDMGMHEFRIIEMTQEEYDALPEFNGF